MPPLVSDPRSGRWRTSAVASAAVSAGTLALMTWQVITRGPFIAWDWSVHEYVDPRVPDGWALIAIDEVSNVGGQRQFTVPILVGFGVWIAYRQRRFRPLAAIFAGLATIFFVGYGIKLGLARTPPADGVDMLHGDGQAFPSGHTANAAFTWFFLIVVLFGSRGLKPDRARFRLWLPIAVGWMLVASALMVALDYHWLSDIPGGWALGALAAAVASRVLYASLPARPDRLVVSPNVQLPGDSVILRTATAADVSAFARIRSTPEVRRRWRGDDDLAAEIRRDLDDPGLQTYAILLDERVVGAIQWSAEDEPDYRHAQVDIYVDPAVHGQGVCTDAVRTLARHLIDDHGQHRITIDPAADNVAAIRCYEKVGFQPVGIMRQYERATDGTWHDGLLMDLLADDLRRS
jgi:RimJ/RimL family protein N-acetyltransferase